MTSHDLGSEDIFKGSEEVEILGKLPAFLWAYIDNARRLVQEKERLGPHSHLLQALKKRSCRIVNWLILSPPAS